MLACWIVIIAISIKHFFDVLLWMDAMMEIITKRLLNGWEIYKSTFGS